MSWIDVTSAIGTLLAGLVVAFAAAAFFTSRAWRIDEEREAIIDADDAPQKENPLVRFVRTRIEGTGVPVTAGEFVWIWAAASLVPLLLGLAVGLPLALTLLITLVGGACPWLWVLNLRNAAKKRFADDLGRVLPLVAGNLRGGLSMRQAIIPVARNLDQPIRGEFERLAQELEQGMSIEQALAGMAERNDNKDLVLLASGVATQAETGGNLADIIEQIGKTIRVRTELRKTISSKTSQQRATSTFLVVMPIIMLVAFCLTNQVFRDFYTSPIGLVVILVCAVLETVGFLIVRKVADIRID